MLDEVGPEAQHLVQNGARHRSEAVRRHPFRGDVRGPERTVLSDLSPDYRRFGRACLDGPSKRPSSRIIGPGADRSSASILLGGTGNSTDGRSGSKSHEHVVYVERHPGPSFRVLCDIVAPCLHDFAPARQQVRSHVRALGAAHNVSQHGFRRLAVHAGFGHPDTNRRSETVQRRPGDTGQLEPARRLAATTVVLPEAQGAIGEIRALSLHVAVGAVRPHVSWRGRLGPVNTIG